VNPEELMSAVRNLIAEKLAVQVASPDTDLLTEGVLDSVTLVQLILQLENAFGIRIELSELEIEDLRSVRSIAGLVTRLQSSAFPGGFELAHATSGTL